MNPPAVTAEQLVAGAHVVAIPMRVPFRGVRVREAVLIQGPRGWGEFAPFPEYDDAEAARWLAAAVEAAWRGWPAPVRDVVAVNATVPAVPVAQVPAVLDRYDDCPAVKVKVAERGQRLRDDVDRVAAVREYVGADVPIRVDANGGWGVDQAVGALAALAPYRLEYAEQPCAAVEDLAALRVALARAGLDVPVAADESIRKVEDPLRVRALAAADLIVVKVAPLGGVRAALEIVEQVGLPAVVSSALDTSVGIAAGVALAAALPELRYACGLGTVNLMERDVGDPSWLPQAGCLRPGAVSVDAAALATLAAAPARRDWWLERLRRCAELLL
jgi:O-succinylbenzoate synthase